MKFVCLFVCLLLVLLIVMYKVNYVSRVTIAGTQQVVWYGMFFDTHEADFSNFHVLFTSSRLVLCMVRALIVVL